MPLRLIQLPLNELHVWRVPIPASPPQRLEECLSEEEMTRYRRFLSPRKAVEFAAARVALRGILGRYLGMPPASIPIAQEVFGKPILGKDIPHGADFQFNLSHCAHLALVAVARHRRVGVDVEREEPARPMQALARRFFAPRESAALDALKPELYVEAFYRCWTAKEAYVKAVGMGLHLPLDRFAVEVNPESPLRLLEGGDENAHWTFHELPVGPGLKAACVVEGEGLLLQMHDLMHE